jgi:predicted nucleic acid-binding protein
MGQEKASIVIASIVNMNGLSIYSVTEEHIKAASALSHIINLGFNDTIAYILMQENDTSQIYSFDRDFDKLPEIERLSN